MLEGRDLSAPRKDLMDKGNTVALGDNTVHLGPHARDGVCIKLPSPPQCLGRGDRYKCARGGQENSRLEAAPTAVPYCGPLGVK